jgi:hypothetical protein
VIKKLIKSLKLGRKLLSTYTLSNGYLEDVGWNLSVKRGVPLNKNGGELPWFTYNSIEFLKSRLNKNHVVYEFGSGNSTLWFSKIVNKIISIEHDEIWYYKLKDVLVEKNNINYLYRNLNSGGYTNQILTYKNVFDVIVLDGRNRVECSKNSIGALKEDGVFIWDNSDRTEYEAGYQFLKTQGFKRLDFWGIGPINRYSWCTSVFYKSENCFDL